MEKREQLNQSVQSSNRASTFSWKNKAFKVKNKRKSCCKTFGVKKIRAVWVVNLIWPLTRCRRFLLLVSWKRTTAPSRCSSSLTSFSVWYEVRVYIPSVNPIIRLQMYIPALKKKLQYIYVLQKISKMLISDQWFFRLLCEMLHWGFTASKLFLFS